MSQENKDCIQVSVTRVLNAKKWKILRLISRVQDFPHYMPNVRECTVLERLSKAAISSWRVEVDGIPLSWKERDEYDLDNFKVTFQAVEGDLEHFSGYWALRDHESGGTEVKVEVNVRIGIPKIEAIVGRLVADKLRKNFEAMISAMGDMLTTKRYKNIGHRKVSDIRGFAVIGHPYNLKHLIKYFKFFKPDFKIPSEQFLQKILELTPSYESYQIKNFKSATGKSADGYFIMCPIVPDMLSLSPDRVFEKVIQACKVCENLGVGIVALGGFTSVAGEKFTKSLGSMVSVPLTTGNTFTVALVLEGIYKAAELMETDIHRAKVTIIGGGGDIGGACARILATKVEELTITGRNEKNLMEMERILSYGGKARIKTKRDNNEAVRNADIVIAAASASNAIVDFTSFKPGAIICDVGYPKNLSYTMSHRNDIFIFSGGLTRLPGEFDLGFDIGLPSTRILYGCFAESVLLDLEERYENFSWGKGNITQEKVDLVNQMAKRHGFQLAPFFWGIRLMSESAIRQIKENMKAGTFKNGG